MGDSVRVQMNGCATQLILTTLGLLHHVHQILNG